jgi:hypothetical protein
VRARVEATAMATAGTTMATQRPVELGAEQERKDDKRGARAAKTVAAPALKDIPAWLDGRYHTAQRRSGDTTSHSRATATLAQRPGATKVMDEGALTYGQHDLKMKAAVKNRSVRRRGGRRR